MSYIALYRKKRPKNFQSVIGQEHIVKTLRNEIATNRIGHCYLFCGTRGTGKTSTAKIFAKALNCENPIDSSPCGQCEMCVAFDENRSLNIIEIDAASNKSVDDIRELKEEIKYPPSKGKYKIYIIDEVHMLSIGAFNALLKTLEEPPSYVIFILATTDPHKIPVTILSRCQRFDFKRISNRDMVNTLNLYMEEENVDIEEDAIYYIAKSSDGAMRDALSLLEQCISFYYQETITLDKVLELLGAVDDEIFFEFTDAIINFNSIEIIDIIDDIVYNGRDISQFVTDMIAHIRNLIIAKLSDNNTLDMTYEKFQEYKNQAKDIEIDYLTKLIDEFSKIQNSLRYSSDERIVLEAGVLKLCCCVKEEDFTDIKRKIKLLEKNIENSVKTVYIEKEEEKPKEEKPRELAIDKDIKEAIDNFKIVKSRFKEFERNILDMCEPRSLENKSLYIVCKPVFIESTKKILEDLKQALFEVFNKDYNIKVISIDEYEREYKALTKQPYGNNMSVEEMANFFPEDILDIN